MIPQPPQAIKKPLLWGLLILFSLAAAYFILLCAVSLRFGITHLSEPGSWMPIAAAVLSLLLTLGLFFRLLRYLLKKIRTQDAM